MDQQQTLIAENQRLREEVVALRAEVRFLRQNRAIAKGIQGEALVSHLLGGKASSVGASHDFTAASGALIEIKYSSLLACVKSRPTRRWVWSKMFGERGQKRYDRLLLIGDVDPRHRELYAAPHSPYVIFDLPFEAATEICGGIKIGPESKLQVTTNPSTVRSWQAQALFNHFQVSPRELKVRYPKLSPVEKSRDRSHQEWSGR